MSSLVFHIEADKVDVNMLDSIKAFFGKKKIHISIADNELSDLIERGKSSNVTYEVPHNIISHLANVMESDESFDVVSEIEKYKTINL